MRVPDIYVERSGHHTQSIYQCGYTKTMILKYKEYQQLYAEYYHTCIRRNF